MTEKINIVDLSNKLVENRKKIIMELNDSTSIPLYGDLEVENNDLLNFLLKYNIKQREEFNLDYFLKNSEIESDKKRYYDFKHKFPSVEKNKELIDKLNKEIFNELNLEDNINENIISTYFYKEDELSQESKTKIVDKWLIELEKNVLRFKYKNILTHKFYNKSSNFFKIIYLINNENVFINTIKENKEEDIYKPLINSFNINNNNLIMNYLRLMKKQKMFKKFFNTDEKVFELLNIIPESVELVDKRYIKKIIKNKDEELIKKIAANNLVGLDKYFEFNDLVFINDEKLISSIVKYNVDFIKKTDNGFWIKEKDIINNLLIYPTENKIKAINEEVNIDKIDFLKNILLLSDDRNASKIISICSINMFRKYLENDKELYKKYCTVYDNYVSKLNISRYDYVKESPISFIFPINYLSDVDYCISLKNMHFTKLNLSGVLDDKLIYSRKYALHHVKSIIKDSTLSLNFFKNRLHPKIYDFLNQAGIKTGAIAFLETYFEKLNLKDKIENKPKIFIPLNNIKEEINLNDIKTVKDDIKIEEKKKVVKL